MLHLRRIAIYFGLSFVALTSAAGAQPAAPSTAVSNPNPPENALVTTRVLNEFNAWQRGRIDRTTYSPAAGGVFDDALVKAVEPDLSAIGNVQTVTYRTASLLLGDVVYRYEVVGTSGVVSVLYSLNDRGQTDNIVFTPKIFSGTSGAL